MHLSLLSDSYLSDRLADAGIHAEDDMPSLGEAHRDGLSRGLVMMGIFAVLIGLGCATSVMPCAQADAFARHLKHHEHVAMPAPALANPARD